jgi:hypothetical protein
MLNANQRNRAHRNRGGRMKPLPWRTVLFGDDTGRFSREQLDHAVRTVMEQRQAYAATRPMMVRECGPGWGVPLPPREADAAPPEPVPYGRARRANGGRRRKGPASGG